MRKTANDSQAIEVEVVEIDGLTVPERPEPAVEERPHRESASWPQWQGKVMNLNPRWWPLWVILGIILFALMLTFGLLIGVVYVIIRIIRSILRAIFG